MYHDKKVAAILPAAGSGKRMKAAVNKIWMELNGEIILARTLRVLQASNYIDLVIMVSSDIELAKCQDYLKKQHSNFRIPVYVTTGGEERQDSVANGLRFLENCPEWPGDNAGLVVIHDGARALLTVELLDEAIAAAWKYGAVGLGTPVKDTIKQADSDGYVVQTPERSTLWAIQTPQVFEMKILSECYRRISGLERNFTDDCSVVEYCGYQVKLIMGSYENIKITTQEDLIIAEGILRGRTNANRSGV